MDRLDFYDKEELLQFLRVKKNEISLIENPKIFLNQLRDHNMIPEDRYEKIIRMRKKENVQKNMYELLQWVEAERREHIALFWKCAFNDTITNQYPRLQILRNSLMDGSFRGIQLPTKSESEKSEQEKSQKASEGEEQGRENRVKSVKKKRKQRGESVEDGEQPGPSCPQTPAQRRTKRRISYSSPLKKGEKTNIWEWPLYKYQLPVTCKRQKGTLIRNRLANGEKCIMVDKKWFSPPEFEKLAGKTGYKNWRRSIKCANTSLQKLIKEGHLKSKPYRGGHQKARKTSVATGDLSTDSEDDNNESDQDDERESSSASTAEEEEEGEERDPQPQTSPSDSNTKVFKVTCGRLEGNLHMNRFASGTRGKSIRTEESWLTPMEFLKEALGDTDAFWRKDIEWGGEPLNVLIESKIHSPLCPCTVCQPSSKDLENQKNDDECCICASNGTLVQCDDCPRSFHQRCHLPHVDDAMCREGNPWLCTFCVYRINQGWSSCTELTWEAAMSRELSGHEMECHYLLMRLRCAERLRTFAVNPGLSSPDDFPVIETPVLLGSVADRLQEKTYKTVGEFVSDVQRIFTNSATHNRENTEMLNETKRLFDEDFRNVFNISS
ncbi:autoimmune regulator-like [Nelusetta ayraudi]|uniref:autoimmune regulator-like n=1 Tax=Nelusetta ayraudi TaxID=303726 RepID=UPI003F6EA763